MSSQVIQLQPAPKTDEQCVRDDLGNQHAEMAVAICDRLACDAVGLEDIAGEIMSCDGHAAACRFYRWRVRSSALARIYARAMESRAHTIAHGLLDAIDAEPDAHRARVKMDAMKWLAAKFNRAQFGDDPVQPGVSVTINNDAGSSALQVLQERIQRKREAIRQHEKSMLPAPGAGDGSGGQGEGDADPLPHTPSSDT